MGKACVPILHLTAQVSSLLEIALLESQQFSFWRIPVRPELVVGLAFPQGIG
jgi:hypothetical protein